MTGQPTEEGHNTNGGRTGGDQSSLRPPWRGDTRWTIAKGRIGPIVLLATLAVLWHHGGLGGIAAWIVIAGSWLVFPPIIPVAIGQFAIVALTAHDAGLMMVLPAEAALLALLGADLITSDQPPIDGLGYAGGTVLLVGVLLGVARTAGGLLAGLVALLVLGTVSYLLHRYLLLDLGHLSDDGRTPAEDRSASR